MHRKKGSPSNSLCYLTKDLYRKVPNRKAKRVAQQQGKKLLYNLERRRAIKNLNFRVVAKCKEKSIVTAGTPETEF